MTLRLLLLIAILGATLALGAARERNTCKLGQESCEAVGSGHVQSGINKNLKVSCGQEAERLSEDDVAATELMILLQKSLLQRPSTDETTSALDKRALAEAQKRSDPVTADQVQSSLNSVANAHSVSDNVSRQRQVRDTFIESEQTSGNWTFDALLVLGSTLWLKKDQLDPSSLAVSVAFILVLLAFAAAYVLSQTPHDFPGWVEPRREKPHAQAPLPRRSQSSSPRRVSTLSGDASPRPSSRHSPRPSVASPYRYEPGAPPTSSAWALLPSADASPRRTASPYRLEQGSPAASGTWVTATPAGPSSQRSVSPYSLEPEVAVASAPWGIFSPADGSVASVVGASAPAFHPRAPVAFSIDPSSSSSFGVTRITRAQTSSPPNRRVIEAQRMTGGSRVMLSPQRTPRTSIVGSSIEKSSPTYIGRASPARSSVLRPHTPPTVPHHVPHSFGGDPRSAGAKASAQSTPEDARGAQRSLSHYPSIMQAVPPQPEDSSFRLVDNASSRLHSRTNSPFHGSGMERRRGSGSPDALSSLTKAGSVGEGPRFDDVAVSSAAPDRDDQHHVQGLPPGTPPRTSLTSRVTVRNSYSNVEGRSSTMHGDGTREGSPGSGRAALHSVASPVVESARNSVQAANPPRTAQFGRQRQENVNL